MELVETMFTAGCHVWKDYFETIVEMAGWLAELAPSGRPLVDNRTS